ncbi:MAG: site-specific DNA-methyltransferase [Halobacteriaceae archaeon]
MEAPETTHETVVGDARSLSAVSDDSVELVVTSPPYPMVEMWDDQFADLSSDAADALAAEEGTAAWDAMHDALADVWAEVDRVLVEGGIACVNVGDATRTVGDRFRVYPNHSRVVEEFVALDFDPLPEILWRKPANSAAKFMGSGMVPPNAYATLEHEYLLVFRNGESRSFEPGADHRYGSAYFWEERNEWFSDVWTDVRGNLQGLDDGPRERSAAFPFEIPYRLINMYSVYGDTVLDPFWGTGTTSLAAMVAGRNSIGVEIDGAFCDVFDERVSAVPDLSRAVARDRLAAHREFVVEADDLSYEATHYDTRVKTKQETDIRFYEVEAVERTDSGYRLDHAPVEGRVSGQSPNL